MDIDTDMRPVRLCRDGVLRLSQGAYDHAAEKHYPLWLPVEALEKKAWPFFFLSLLGAEVEFEEGLEVGEALRNLAPWTAEVSALTGARLDLMIAEASQPPGDDEIGYLCRSDLDTLGFVYQHELGAVSKRERDDDFDIENMFERIPGSRMYRMRGERRPLVSDLYTLSGRWDCLGFRTGTVDFFDKNDNGFWMCHSPLRKWSHLKLKVVGRAPLWDTTPGSDYLSHKGGLLDVGNPLVADAEKGAYPRRAWVAAPTPTLGSVVLDCLVAGCRAAAHPERLAEMDAGLEESIRECDADKELQASLRGPDGEVDPVKLAAAEAVLEAEERERKAKRKAEREAERAARKAARFDEGSRELIGLAKELEARAPGSVVAPEGLPDGV
jgi:hypothetical protein